MYINYTMLAGCAMHHYLRPPGNGYNADTKRVLLYGMLFAGFWTYGAMIWFFIADSYEERLTSGLAVALSAPNFVAFFMQLIHAHDGEMENIGYQPIINKSQYAP